MTTTILNPIDEIGALDAQIAELNARREILAAQVKAQGPGSYEGALFNASVSEFSRTSTDWKTVAERAGASRQLIAAHSRQTLVTTLRVVGR